MRRRQRRLRSMLRHEQQSVAMALAQALHHSAGPSNTKVVERPERQEERCKKRTTLDPGPPGDEAVAVGYAAASVPLLGAPSLADSSAEAIDGSTLSFLLQRALDDKRKEKEEAKLVAEVNELEEKVAKAEARAMEEIDRLRQLGEPHHPPQPYLLVVPCQGCRLEEEGQEEEKEEEEKAGANEAAVLVALMILFSVPADPGSHLFGVGLA